MPQRIAVCHYAGPPVVGGVESTIAHHARGLTDLGYTVRVVSGRGAPFDERIETLIVPLIDSTHPDILAVKQYLDRGVVPPAFEPMRDTLVEALAGAFADCDVAIVHNAHTMNKNLALTAALAQLDSPRLIAWCHDVAWTNPQYQSELYDGYPWDLLRQPWPGTRYVTVSEARQTELADLLHISPGEIAVVGPGVDPARFLRWTATTQRIVQTLGLLDADVLLYLPARLTRRKNVALALRVLAEMRRQSGLDVRLIVTGPPGPHNPANPGYLGELLALRRQLGLETAAHFLYEMDDPPLVPDDDAIADLYRICDVLFFPSFQEGFGIPMLEAGLSGMLIFCSDILALRASGLDDAAYFDPAGDPPQAIAARVLAALASSPGHRLRRRVRQSYRWEAIVRERLVPLIKEQHD
ncbi:MAG: glycosyltransferase family 4 protein [Anaerolineae bacterium]